VVRKKDKSIAAAEYPAVTLQEDLDGPSTAP
jgi:hypothetical protein